MDAERQRTLAFAYEPYFVWTKCSGGAYLPTPGTLRMRTAFHHSIYLTYVSASDHCCHKCAGCARSPASFIKSKPKGTLTWY